jgi:hypothetical protein
MLVSPTAENWVSEIYNRPACVQFFLVYAVFWLVLWVPASRAGRLTLVGAVALSAVSTFLVTLLIPLALVRLYVRRDRVSLAVAALLSGGLAVQMAGLALHLTNRDFTVPRYQPLWALKSFAIWAVPQSFEGYRMAHATGDVLLAANLPVVLLPWLGIGAVVYLAVRRVTNPSWLLAVVAAGHSAALCCMTIMSNGIVTQRYLVPVELLLFTAVAALLLPVAGRPPRLALAPLAVFAVLVLAASAANYRWDNTFRHRSPRWAGQVAKAKVACQVPGVREVLVRSGPEPYFSVVMVPCHELQKRGVWCEPTYCREVGLPPTRLQQPVRDPPVR